MRKPSFHGTTLLAFALALLFGPDCTGETGGLETAADPAPATTTGGDEPADGVVIAAAVWTLAWDTDGVAFPAEGGLDLETDLGYHVHLQSAHILSHSVSLGPCDPAPDGTTARRGTTNARSPMIGAAALPGSDALSRLLAWLDRRSFIRSAHAHTDNVEPSMIETSLIEDLTHPQASESASAFPAARYCRAHWLLARPMAETSGPDDISMEGLSISLNGSFEREGPSQDFAIDTWWPQGTLRDLDELVDPAVFEVARADGAPRHAFVTVTRHLGRLFDGVDFESASHDQIAGLALDNLVGTADLAVELWAPASPP